MSTYTRTGPPTAWKVATQPAGARGPGQAPGSTWSTGATYSAPGRVKRRARGDAEPVAVLVAAEVAAAANSQCGRSPHLVMTMRDRRCRPANRPAPVWPHDGAVGRTRLPARATTSW